MINLHHGDCLKVMPTINTWDTAMQAQDQLASINIGLTAKEIDVLGMITHIEGGYAKNT